MVSLSLWFMEMPSRRYKNLTAYSEAWTGPSKHHISKKRKRLPVKNRKRVVLLMYEQYEARIEVRLNAKRNISDEG